MRSTLRLMAVGVMALLIGVPAALAQTPEASVLPVTEPLDVGGTILQPGTYLIRVLPSTTGRNKVQITSMDRQTVYATVLTVPHPLEPGEEVPNTTFIYYPAGEGMPRALRTWFAPNPEASQGGHDIVYDERRARQLARLAESRVTYYPEQTVVADFDTAPLQVVTPEARVETHVQMEPAAPLVTETRVETHEARVRETESPMISAQTQVAEAQTIRMPRTASSTPLLALLGLLSVAGALAFRTFRG